MASLLSRGDIYSVVAEVDRRVVGSNFLWENGVIAGVGPITIDPAAQNAAVGRRLMEDVLRRAEERNIAGVRLVQAAYHNRSLSLYTKLGFDTREPLSNARVPSPRTVILIDQLHGAARRVAPSEAAFAHRDTRHNVMTMSMWAGPAKAETNIAWTRGLSAAIEPFASGAVYVNGAYEQRPSAAYGANYERLVEIKTAYDPTNFFRHNQNIRPKTQAA